VGIDARSFLIHVPAALGLCLGGGLCLAQGRVSEFLTVKNWHGTVTITGSGSGSTKGGPYSDVWDYGITTKLNVQLNTYDANIQGWTGTFTGTSQVNAKDVATFGNCVETFTQIFDGTLNSPFSTAFTMVLRGTNQYAFYPGVYTAQGAATMVSLDCVPGGPMGSTGPYTFAPVISNNMQILPPTGFNLTGSQKMTMDSPVQPLSLNFGGSAAQIEVTVSWDISPGPQTDAEVVIQKTSAFQNWRPTAGSGGGRGNGVSLTAKLQAKGGGTTNVKAAYFIWQLTNSSKEPGYAMNAPKSSPNKDFDLKLEGGDLLFDDPATAQSAKTRAGEQTQSTETIASYDWGAFGTVKVTAVMPDGSQIVGYLEGDPSQTDVRLPLRTPNSFIADVWKQNHGVTGQADNSDNESDPPGDGNAGDGLTLYEEYRGFIINGQHVEGDPKKKDYFILNRAGTFYLGGIRMFQSLSGLIVHDQLKGAELSDGRVINFNYSAGPHKVDQHGVIIVPIAANAGYAEAQGGPGPPKSISQIVAPKILPSADLFTIDYLASSLAHELFHACNVYHHGDGPSPSGTFRLVSSTNTTLFQGVPANVLTEAGDSYPLPADTNVTYQLGGPGDTHVGFDSCVMRYDDARGYFSKSDGHTIYLVTPEGAGTTLCTQSAGTGINDAGRTPQARYGDSAQGRGNCRGQILVNDAVNPPKR
jgi:hypothetical protein